MQNLVDVYEKATAQLQTVVSQTPSRIKKLNEVVSKADLEIMDLLHLAELESFNAAEGYYIAQKIKKARLKRRAAKDEIDFLLDLKNLSNNNSKFEVHIQGMQKSIKNIRDSKSKRQYTPRVRSDLVERFNKCNKSKLLK